MKYRDSLSKYNRHNNQKGWKETKEEEGSISMSTLSSHQNSENRRRHSMENN